MWLKTTGNQRILSWSLQSQKLPFWLQPTLNTKQALHQRQKQSSCLFFPSICTHLCVWRWYKNMNSINRDVDSGDPWLPQHSTSLKKPQPSVFVFLFTWHIIIPICTYPLNDAYSVLHNHYIVPLWSSRGRSGDFSPSACRFIWRAGMGVWGGVITYALPLPPLTVWLLILMPAVYWIHALEQILTDSHFITQADWDESPPHAVLIILNLGLFFSVMQHSL